MITATPWTNSSSFHLLCPSAVRALIKFLRELRSPSLQVKLPWMKFGDSQESARKNYHDGSVHNHFQGWASSPHPRISPKCSQETFPIFTASGSGEHCCFVSPKRFAVRKLNKCVGGSSSDSDARTNIIACSGNKIIHHRLSINVRPLITTQLVRCCNLLIHFDPVSFTGLGL